ncbi:MAG: hypothetical protein ACREQ4_03565 [Candidatus Binataceae bacterium]
MRQIVPGLTSSRHKSQPNEMSSRYAQPILYFFCRPCGEYHEKTHPHYAEAQARAAERSKAGTTRKRKTKKERG